MAITRRQRQVYDFISEFVQKHGYSPSFEEIGEGLGLSSLATVHKHISNLEKKALLTRDYNRSRSIDLLPPKGRLKQAMSVNTTMVLPLLGRIAAGQPIEAVENPETISLADFVRSKEVFVLEVRGDSMQDEHIMSGDYVLVEKAKTAHNGDIVSRSSGDRMPRSSVSIAKATTFGSSRQMPTCSQSSCRHRLSRSKDE